MRFLPIPIMMHLHQPLDHVHFYVSKPLALAYQITMVAGSAFITIAGALAAAGSYASGTSAIWIVVFFCLALVGISLSIVSWRLTSRWLRLSRLPLIAFDNEDVSWRCTPGDSTTFQAGLSSISGVECKIYGSGKTYSACIYIQRWAVPGSHIDITLLKATPKQVFGAFKERLPSLVQPQSEVQRLIANRYASTPSGPSESAA